MKKTTTSFIFFALMSSAVAMSAPVMAGDTSARKATQKVVNIDQNEVNKKAISDKANSQYDLLKEVNKGISEGFRKVIDATQFLKEGKQKEAIKALQEATGKFDIALAADPDIALIPIASGLNISELIITPEAIRVQTRLAKELLEDYKVQAARAILLPLRDEMVTRTTFLPMTTYPDAIKLASKMLVDGKTEAAQEILATALSTFVQENSVIPLSILRVEAIIQSASMLDKEKDKEKVLTLLHAADQQLQVAKLLGYTDEDSALYDDLSAQIKVLEKEAKGDNVVEKLYKDLKSSISKLIGAKSKPAADK